MCWKETRLFFGPFPQSLVGCKLFDPLSKGQFSLTEEKEMTGLEAHDLNFRGCIRFDQFPIRPVVIDEI